MNGNVEQKRKKVLIADDSEMNRSILADILGEECDILEAANGKDAIETLQKYNGEIALLLLDMVMPEMDGFEVLAIMNKSKQRVPIIMICPSDSISRYIERAYALGVSDYISPPFDFLVVYRRATNVIKLYSSCDEHLVIEKKNKNVKVLQYDEFASSKRTLELLEQERTKYRFFESMSHEIQFEYSENPPLVRLSEYGQQKFNCGELFREPQYNQAVMSIVGEDNYRRVAEMLHATTPYDPVRQMDLEINVGGEKRWNRLVCRAMWSNEKTPRYTGAIGKLTDIHEQHMRMVNLQYAAAHDSLTGIYNHAYAREKIINLFQEHPKAKYALAIFDIDHFKQVNDTYGHMVGDHVLQYVVQKLKNCARADDILARIGGDEFLIFMNYTGTPDKRIDEFFRSLAGECEGVRYTVSMGISDTELLGRDYNVLFRCADQALYTCKRSGRGRYRFYDVTMKSAGSFKKNYWGDEESLPSEEE